MNTQRAINDALLNISDFNFSVNYTNRPTKPGAPELVGPHIHNCYEIYVNFSGDVSFLVNNKLYRISSGDIIKTCAGDVHHCIINKTCMHEHFCIWIEEAEDSPLTEFLRNTESPYLNLEDEEVKKTLFSLLSRLESVYETENGLSKTAAMVSILDLIATKSAVAVTQNENIPPALQQILDYMNSNFAEIQYVNDVLSNFFISPSTLNRWFRRYIHLSPHEFLETKKLGYAEQLLQKGYTVTEVSDMAGFSDSSHFISVFKKRFGRTPHKYKRMMV